MSDTLILEYPPQPRTPENSSTMLERALRALTLQGGLKHFAKIMRVEPRAHEKPLQEKVATR